MNYLLRCLACGATCWCRGDDDPDVNALTLDEDGRDWKPDANAKVIDTTCQHEDLEVIDEEYPEPMPGDFGL